MKQEDKTLLPAYLAAIKEVAAGKYYSPTLDHVELLLQALEAALGKVERAKEALKHPDLDDCTCQPDNPMMEVWTHTKHPKCGFCVVKQAIKELEE